MTSGANWGAYGAQPPRGVLFAGPYPERLLAAAAELVEPGEGLLAGRYGGTWEPNRVLSLK